MSDSQVSRIKIDCSMIWAFRSYYKDIFLVQFAKSSISATDLSNKRIVIVRLGIEIRLLLDIVIILILRT
jgi:hypothetical protein